MDKSHKGYLIVLFFVSPFLGLLNIFKLRNEKEIVFFVMLFFGLAGSVAVFEKGSDGFTHRFNAEKDYLDMTLPQFVEKSYQILSFNSVEGSTDIYIHSISFLSASILQAPDLTHVFSALVLGFFFSKSVLLVLKDNLNAKKGAILLGCIALFLLIRSLGALNSIRMWTGMWVLFYGTYSWALTKEKKYLFVSLFAVFVHFSYGVILIPVIIGYLLQNRKILLVTIYAVSFFSTLGFNVVESYIPQSKLIESKQKTYGITSDEDEDRYEDNEEIRKVANENSNFYKSIGQQIYFSYSIVGLSIILIFFYLRKDVDVNLKFLVATGLSIYLFSNLVAFSPSLQFRTKMIAATFILASAIHLQLRLNNYNLSKKNSRRLNIGLVAFLISSIPVALFHLSYLLQMISFFIFLFPEISWLLGDGDYSIRNVLGLVIGK